MPIDPGIAPLLAAINEAPKLPRSSPDDAIAIRRDADKRAAQGNPYLVFADDPRPIADIHEELVEVAGGPDQIPVTIYRSEKALAGGAAGAVVMFHGGSWFTGDRAGADARSRLIADTHDVVVVSVEYRLAPEHQFPIPGEDCYEATAWTAEHLGELGVAGDWLAVAGESAGANLAAVVALLAQRRGGPRLALQVLEIPALDLSLSSPSVAKYAHGYVLDRDDMQWCVQVYLGDHDPKDPLASPLWAPDVAGLPPAVIFTAECDPLADDGRRYASRLSKAGVDVYHHQFPGQVHGSQQLTRLLPAAREWRDDLLRSIGDSLAAGTRP